MKVKSLEKEQGEGLLWRNSSLKVVKKSISLQARLGVTPSCQRDSCASWSTPRGPPTFCGGRPAYMVSMVRRVVWPALRLTNFRVCLVRRASCIGGDQLYFESQDVNLVRKAVIDDVLGEGG